MLVEVSGGKDALRDAMLFLESQGLVVHEAASDIHLDEEACVTCGLCTAVCGPRALSMSGETLVFDKDRCVYCEACVVACPRRAVALEF